jgi:hypothetical protein
MGHSKTPPRKAHFDGEWSSKKENWQPKEPQTAPRKGHFDGERRPWKETRQPKEQQNPPRKANFDGEKRSSGKETRQPKEQQSPPRKANFDGERKSGWQQDQKEPLAVADILDEYMQLHEKLKPHQVSSAWNKLGKAVQKSPSKGERLNFWINHNEALQMLVKQTIHSVNEFDGRSTATVTHSLVKLLRLANSKRLGALQSLWNILIKRTKLLLEQSDYSFNEQDISNLLWAYARAADGIIKVDTRLLDALAARAELCIDEFSPPGLANVAWGFATLNHEAPFLFDAIARAAQMRINDFTPQELANLIVAFAKMNRNSPTLFEAIAQAAQRRINDFNPQDLSYTAWSFATLNHQAPLLFDDIAEASLDCIGDFTPQALSNTAWAFATMKHEAPILFAAIAKAAHEAPSLFVALAKAAQVSKHDFNPHELPNILLQWEERNKR